MSTQAYVAASPAAPAVARRLRAVHSHPSATAGTRGLVERRRLLRSLADATSLVLLTAPAGYGKSTLLRQWDARDDRTFTWVTAGDQRDDAGALCEATARWAAAASGAVLVVDDAHLLEAPEGLEALAAAMRLTSPDRVLAVASRRALGLPLGRLRAEDRVVELRTDALAMTEAESATMLRRLRAPHAGPEVALLHARTEGWPAALRLAVLALREQGDDPDAVAAFGGDDRFIATYLRDEVLSVLTAAQLAFLRSTSVLDRLSGPLCDAVAERAQSAELLRQIAAVDVPLGPIDRAEEHFRCHHLVADALRADLRRDMPAEFAARNRLASTWYEEQGDVERAIDHAIAAGDGERTGRLVWSIAARYAFGGRAASLEAWLAHFSPDEIALRPELALAAAAGRLMVGDGDEAERWVDAADSAVSASGVEPASSVAAALAAVRAGVARDGLVRMGRAAAEAYAADAHDGPWKGFACLLGGTAKQLGGDLEGGRVLLEEGVRRAGSKARPMGILCLAQLSTVALMKQPHDEGAALAGKARIAMVGARLEEAPTSALVLCVSALALAQEGPVDAALSDAATAMELLDRMPSVAPWYLAECCLVLARAQLRLGDPEQARNLLCRAERTLRAVPDGVLLQAWLEDAWDRADAFAERSVTGPAMLTPAELRILRFLPSHLSFREIALRLHVSANTVKTQAHAVYRKLDASSRSEAVHRARSVGLVDG